VAQRIKNAHMKTLFRTNNYILVGLAIAGSAIIFSCANPSQTVGSSRKVEINENGIVIHPAVKLSPADEQALNNVLQHHSKALYKIQAVDNGQVTQVKGKLRDTAITSVVKSEMASGGKGKSHWTHQVMCPSCDEWKPTDLTASETKQLVAQLKPILEKY
jgi:hypothetical protein